MLVEMVDGIGIDIARSRVDVCRGMTSSHIRQSTLRTALNRTQCRKNIQARRDKIHVYGTMK